MKIDWQHAYSVERQVAEILARQEQYGWLIDREGAEKLVEWLLEQQSILSQSVLPNLPKVLKKENELKKIFKKDGQYNSHASSWLESIADGSSIHPKCIPSGSNRVLSGPFTRLSYQAPSLTSPPQIKSALFSLGWIPDEWNYKKDKNKKLLRDDNGELIPTSPKITESSFDSVRSDHPFAKDLIQLLKVQARLKFFGCYGESTIDDDEDGDDGKGLLSHIRPDSTIASEVIQCGTNTGRAQHRKVANVPRPGSFLGDETRSLFLARPGRLLVGTDYSALESNIIAHAIYLYTKWKYGKGDERFMQILESVDDIHVYLWDDLRDMVSSRALVKNINYAFPYGAQAAKLGSLCDLKPSSMSNVKAGERVLEVMQDKFPGLVETRDATVAQAKSGTLLGLDGRIIYVRSPHSAFNAKIQGWGSEVVKKGMTLRWKYIKELDVDSEQVGYYHDEWQAEPDEDCVDAEIECSQRAVKESGEYYNLSVPMTGESKVGRNWKETH
jgi:hypothetical protein